MKKIKAFIKNNRHIFVLLYWIIHSVWYEILQSVTMGRKPTAISCAADRLIPFSEWFVIPYALWYVQIIAVTLYLLLKNKRLFLRLYVYLFGGMFICMMICTLFPMYFDRTGIAMYPYDNLLTDAVKLIQGIDPPTTVLPSMHVYVTLGLHIALCRDEAFGKERLAVVASGFFTLCVCVATLFTKQHSLYDVLAALPLCAVMCALAYVPKYKKLFRFFGAEDKVAV